MAENIEQEKLQQLQLLEQANQNLMVQKQNFQSQLIEVESAIEELKKTDSAYKIVGSIMIASKKDELTEDLIKKQEILNLRVKAIEKQESQIKEKFTKLQADVIKGMQGNSSEKGHECKDCGDDCDCGHKH